jgi:hypothetical protein
LASALVSGYRYGVPSVWLTLIPINGALNTVAVAAGAVLIVVSSQSHNAARPFRELVDSACQTNSTPDLTERPPSINDPVNNHHPTIRRSVGIWMRVLE